MWTIIVLTAALASPGPSPAGAAETITVRPREIDGVLVNPGIGFMTFQRFNGDRLNEGKDWTEGYPIVAQPFKGRLEIDGYPATSLAYFRIYWKFLEPESGRYRWELIDQALKPAGERGQTLLLRVAPYGSDRDNDVPAWYRSILGAEPELPESRWRTNPEDPRYVQHFGGLIRALGRRYDGHPLLESVDLAVVGPWGEGAGADRLSQKAREALIDCYIDTFRSTHLVMLLTDEKTNRYGLSKRAVGWRVDCLGDMGGFSESWCHMCDAYPQEIIRFGMKDAWRKAPVSFEACWVMRHWKEKGWDLDYIIDQSLKWHISSFNAKSSRVPDEWRPQVDRWLKRMGYRFVLRKLSYPGAVPAGSHLRFTSWWENKGVAPCYHPFRLALRVKNDTGSHVLPVTADIRTWLPGDAIADGSVRVPTGAAPGVYELQVGILGETDDRPKVKLAIAGADPEGWYPMGKVRVLAPDGASGR